MQLLFDIAVFMAIVKITSTLWLVRQPDATTVTATLFGRAGKRQLHRPVGRLEKNLIFYHESGIAASNQ